MLQTVRIRKPRVPHGPRGVDEDTATADYLTEAAQRVRNNRWWGSNVTNTVATLIEDAVRALRNPEPEAREDDESLRRIIDSACGTDAAHYLIAKALREQGWVGPEQRTKVEVAYVQQRDRVEQCEQRLDEAREHIDEVKADLDRLLAEYRASVDPAPYTSERAFVERAEAVAATLDPGMAAIPRE